MRHMPHIRYKTDHGALWGVCCIWPPRHVRGKQSCLECIWPPRHVRGTQSCLSLDAQHTDDRGAQHPDDSQHANNRGHSHYRVPGPVLLLCSCYLKNIKHVMSAYVSIVQQTWTAMFSISINLLDLARFLALQRVAWINLASLFYHEIGCLFCTVLLI